MKSKRKCWGQCCGFIRKDKVRNIFIQQLDVTQYNVKWGWIIADNISMFRSDLQMPLLINMSRLWLVVQERCRETSKLYKKLIWLLDYLWIFFMQLNGKKRSMKCTLNNWDIMTCYWKCINDKSIMDAWLEVEYCLISLSLYI